MGEKLSTRSRMTLQRFVREVRLAQDVCQKRLAEWIGERPSLASTFEHSERRLDALKHRDICQALGMSLAEFVDWLERRCSK